MTVFHFLSEDWSPRDSTPVQWRGLGLAQSSEATCGAELRSGALVALLTDYALEPVEVHALFPAGPPPSTKVRAFAYHLAAALSGASFLYV